MVRASLTYIKILIIISITGMVFYFFKITPEKPLSSQEIKTSLSISKLEFTLPDLNGNDNEFSKWNGKHRIVNFWATWCAPCRREIPLLKSFQNEHGEENGFQVIGVAVDFLDPVKDYAKDTNFNYPILIGEKNAIEVAELSGIEFVGLPFTMFVSSDEHILGAYIGEIHQSHLDAFTKVTSLLDRKEISITEARSTLNKF